MQFSPVLAVVVGLVRSTTQGLIPLRYPGRRPVASWNLAYHALSSSLARGSRCHFVWRYASPKRLLDGDPASPSPKRGRSPQFSAHVYYGQTAGWIKMALGIEVGLGPGSSLSPKRGLSLQFSAHVCCGQMAAWIKMSLCMEVGLAQATLC